MFQVTREIRFCYGHRLLNYDGKCRHLHGHNGRAVITLQAEELDTLGMVGVTIGCSVGQTQVGLMFSLVVTPMIMFGCAYYPWAALSNFPILQKAVLINPLVYASEGFRSALVPGFPHLPSVLILAGLLFFNGLFITLGLQRFRAKALT